jgi:hypothetical protein
VYEHNITFNLAYENKEEPMVKNLVRVYIYYHGKGKGKKINLVLSHVLFLSKQFGSRRKVLSFSLYFFFVLFNEGHIREVLPSSEKYILPVYRNELWILTF